MKKLYLVDGSGYIFRAYYGLARDRSARLTAKDGTPTNAVFVFNQMLQRLLKDVRAGEHVLLGIAFDTGKSNFRHQLFPQYKANREAPPEDLSVQIPLIHALVDAYDIPLLLNDAYEADDVIATFAKEGARRGLDVVVVSADKDLMQLVDSDEKHKIAMWDPMRDQHYGREEVKAKFGVYPEQLGDYFALVGDAVDNVPGVPKVGKKTAEELIHQFGTLAALLERPEEIAKKSVREAVIAHKADALLSRQLVSLKDDLPIAFDEGRLAYTGPLREKLEPLFQRLSFAGQRVDDAMATRDKAATPAALAASAAPAPHTPDSDLVSRADYRTILDEAALASLCAELAKAGRFALDTQTTSSDAMRAEIVGIALCATPGKAAYIPISHRYLGAPKQLPLATVVAALRPVLAKAAIVGQNVKYDLHVLRNAGLEIGTVGDDAMLLSYVIDPGRESHGLDYAARVLLGHENLRLDGMVGKGRAAAFDEVDLERAAAFAAESADVALRVCDALARELPESQVKLYRNVELPLLGVLFEMEHKGIAVEPKVMGVIGKELDLRMKEIEREIKALAGFDVNINSPKQLAELLFGKLQLPVTKRTKSGPSTDMSVLEALAAEHPLPQMILDYRQVQKLLSTYVETLPRLIHPRTGRVHTSFNQALAATGRLSSSDPNLQNIPVKTDLGRRIRSAFVAAKGSTFVSADYSQIELRMLAHLSEDAALLDAFRHGVDIHEKTAMALFGVGNGQVTPEMRRRAKTVNFGLLYGLSAFRLSREEKVPIAEAKAFIDAYFAAYPSVRQFMDRTLARAREAGYVETILGRRRYLPELNSRNHTAKQQAERIAVNTPIQGSAADLMKIAMLELHAALMKEGLLGRMLLQVHDELVLECPLEESATVSALVKEKMQSALELRVPLEVSVSVGADWSLVH